MTGGDTGSSHKNPWPAEWDATAYHRLSGPQVTWGEQVQDRLSLRGGETVLNAGCGMCRLKGDRELR
jgi:hypothetical protein